MKRIIVNFEKLNSDILDLLVKKYPNGYNAVDIVSFHDIKHNLINAIQVETEDTIYLVKVSNKLANSMEEHTVDDVVIPEEIIEDNLDEDLFIDTDSLDDEIVL
jgi:hypothetical protein